MFIKHYAPNRCEPSIGGGGCHDGCERRIEVFVKIQKKKKNSGWGGGGGGGGGVFGLGGGVRKDVYEELKFFVKIQKNN